MPRISSKTDRLDIYIDKDRKLILIEQKWKYVWSNKKGTTPWSHKEKKKFHNKSDHIIENLWGGKMVIRTKGSSDFAKKYADDGFVVNFDLKWVTNDEHWKVRVTKIPKGEWAQSWMKWTTREVNLDTEDIKMRRTSTIPRRTQSPVAHEFGHTIGNTFHTGVTQHGDEYKTNSKYNTQTKSIMNIGNEIKPRHLDYIVSELNKMVPNTEFYVKKINWHEKISYFTRTLFNF